MEHKLTFFTHFIYSKSCVIGLSDKLVFYGRQNLNEIHVRSNDKFMSVLTDCAF